MLSQRLAQQSLRRLAASASKPAIASQMMFKKSAAPLAISSSIQTRSAATQILTPKDSDQILAAQRKKRPTSPHLTIYNWQIPMTLSIANRITGGMLSGGMYIFGLGYLASPLLGLSMDSASMAAAFASWPVAAKVATKFLIAVPFTFHSFNGVRHLIWDNGRLLRNQQVIRSGQATIAIAVATSLALATLV